MYKTRLHQWGLDKKLKEHEARAIIQMHARRNGKATRMRLRDLSVDIKKAYSHFKRKGISIDNVLDSEAALHPELVCETPVASPAPMSQDLVPIVSRDSTIAGLQNLMTVAGPQDIGSPRAFRMVEMLFAEAREYLCCSIHFDHGHSPSRKQAHTPSLEASYKVHAEIRKACYRFDQYQEVEVLEFSGKDYSNLENIVEESSCEVALLMILTIAMLLNRQRMLKSTALTLCKQLYSAATNSKSRESPIVSVLGRLFSKLGFLLHYGDDASDYLLAIVHVFIDSLKTTLGPVDVRTVYATVILSRVTRSLYGPNGLLGPLENLRSSLEEQDGWGMRQSDLIMTEIINLNLACGHYQTAQNLLRQVKSTKHAIVLGKKSFAAFLLGQLSRE